jgi:hypothetical protein
MCFFFCSLLQNEIEAAKASFWLQWLMEEHDGGGSLDIERTSLSEIPQRIDSHARDHTFLTRFVRTDHNQSESLDITACVQGKSEDFRR